MATPNYGMGSGLASSLQWNQSNSNNWDYGGWHNNTYSGCHQQVYAAGIFSGSGYNHVQRSCGNASVRSHDSDSNYWEIHAYHVPDHVQETCSTSFRTSEASDDCYWSVCTFPVSSTKPHVTQTQPILPDGTVGYSLKVPPKAEYQEMQVGVPPEQQSQMCEQKELSLEQLAFLKQKYDEAQDNLNQSKECHESSNEKDIHTLCRKLLADLKHIQEERKTMELEAQRKHEEEEIHKELEHFLYNAFNLFEEEQQESEHAPKCFTKPIFSQVSHDAFGEDATAFTSIHVPHLFVGGSIECSMSNNKIELTSLHDSELCGKPGEAQQVNNQHLNKLITDAGRKQWDPGILS